MITDNTIQRIKDANDIVEVVSNSLTLKRAGINYIGVCPFHDDKSPSMTVSKIRQTYKCWSCGASGDVISFVQNHEHIDFHEALRLLAKKTGIEVEDKEITPEQQQKLKEKDDLYIVTEAATKFFQENLSHASEFLEKRGYQISDPVISSFRIGFAPASNKLNNTLPANGYSQKNLFTADILKQNEAGNFYDTFRERIQFPFVDLNGRVIGFSGRIINDNEKTGKYINTGDTPIYSKGKNLFGLYQAKTEIARKENVFLVEGQFDVTAFHREGVTNTVAGSGTALTPDQVKLIARFTRKVTLVYDADKAGMTASIKNCEALLAAGLTVKCISLPSGQDPDNVACEKKEKLEMWLSKNTLDFLAYFYNALGADKNDPDARAEALNTITKIISAIPDDLSRSEHIRRLCALFNIEEHTQTVKSKIKEYRGSNQAYKKTDSMKPGIYGLEELAEGLQSKFDEYDLVTITSDFQEFINEFSDRPIVYVHKEATIAGIHELRAKTTYLYAYAKQVKIENSRENDYLASLVNIYKAGLNNIMVEIPTGVEDIEDDTVETETISFICYYVNLYATLIRVEPQQKPAYIGRIAELLSFSPESERYVYISDFAKKLELAKSALEAIIKPLLERRKNKQKIESQRDDNALEILDGFTLPDYVEENEKYKKMYQNYQYFPYLNTKGEPVAYVFKDKNGHQIVGDFYLEPLLHIYNKDPELNRRVFKVNRRFYVKPFFMEFKSSSLLMKTTFEAVIINEEAMNFDNATNEHWIKIRSCMSHDYTMVNEINVYGQQNEDFFAFSNAIFHKVGDMFRIDLANEIGVTSHSTLNYYHPAASIINRDFQADQDKYELIRQLKFDGKNSSVEDLVAVCSGDNNELERRKRFAKWADLMNKVYPINDNGKWALLYAIMCAFRSDIHSIDRTFTALFFMGPTMSGKTQLAISIRSIYISPKQPAFNLNTGTDAAMSTLMGIFRDVPVVLEEYNNKEISDIKFQALKAITYDGDSKQKRKGTSGKDIELDKIFAPVVICGQETPQRDDNALMNRIIVCEVPKLGLFSEDAKELFQELKLMENEGLSDVLFEVLQLRPLIRVHFRTILKEISKELTSKVLIGSNASGDMVRIINTASLFLTLCKIITEHAKHLQLPFTFDEFFEIAAQKVVSQVEMITHSDKLANFFKAMDVMLDTGIVKSGRDFSIESPSKVTFKISGKQTEEKIFAGQKRILFLRVSNLYICYARNYNSEGVSQTTLEQNLRSHPAYLGVIDGWRFKWLEERSVPAGESIKVIDGVEQKSTDMSMRKIMEKQNKTTSCMALDYDLFLSFYEDLDFDRSKPKIEPIPSTDVQELPPF